MDATAKSALEGATTSEGLVCAIADMPLTSHGHSNEQHMVACTDFNAIIVQARIIQADIDSSISRLLHALADIRDIRTEGQPQLTLSRARDIARNAINAHARRN